MRAFVSEDGAVDTLLSPLCPIVGVVNELPPSEERICMFSSEDKFFSGSDEQFDISPLNALPVAVVPEIHFEAIKVAILCEPP